MTHRSDAFDQACRSPESNLLVIAPPGCGKTELLARRAEFLTTRLEPGQRILALTFSNKAKRNLESRLVKILGAERKRRLIAVRNFHGHAAEILRSHGRTLGLDPDFAMPTRYTQKQAVDTLLEGLGRQTGGQTRECIDHSLRWAKSGPYDDACVLERLNRAGDALALQVETERTRLFYDDLLRHAQRLLGIPQIARLYQAHYGAVLVDEVQDLSIQHLEIALHTCAANRTFVGDPLQGIYSWAGAQPNQVERRLREICAETTGLEVSFRSSPRVLQLLSAVSTRMDGPRLESNTPQAWHEDGMSALGDFPNAVEEARFIRCTAVEITQRQPDATVGILCRNQWRRSEIDKEFDRTGTPCTRWNRASDDSAIVDLIDEAIARSSHDTSLTALKNKVLSLVERTDPDTASDVDQAFTELPDLVDRAGTLTAALAELRERTDSAELIPPGIHLLNAHIGKGQQFDWVFIVGFEDGNTPSFQAENDPEQTAEEHRILLVMISRARHGIVITRARNRTSKRGKTYPSKPSRWTSEIESGGVADLDDLARHIQTLPPQVR